MQEPTNGQLLGAIQGIDTRLDGMDKRFDAIDRSLYDIDQRLGNVELMVDGISQTVRTIPDDYVTHEDLHALESRLGKKIDQQAKSYDTFRRKISKAAAV
ncbi:MAG: hypothetical protein QFB87_05530 [Patescibacteria group bacterium]|nr:hypothetical protein [Patescibacteria group bacterium]